MSHYNCCVPHCTNSFRNAPYLHYYRIPKDPDVRKKYVVLIRNETLKVNSESTRICSAHFDGGEKLSRTHLPSIFPWTKQMVARRELKRVSFEETQKIEQTKKRKTPLTELPLDALCQQSKENFSVDDTSTSVEIQTSLTGDLLNNLHDSLRTREQEIAKLKEEIHRLEKENKNIKEMNSKFQQEMKSLKHALDNNRFDIDQYKDKDDDISFYTGFPDYKTLILCYKTVEQSARNISYEHKRTTLDSNVGRPRVLTKFQEFILVMLRLRLGLFENDLAHRFKVCRSTVSKVVNAWIPFLRREFEPLIAIPQREVLQYYMPESFKKLLPNVTVIVDCTEFEMERPSALDSQSACYSSYKSRTTMKSMLGITPSGVLCFVSDLFPGSTSDKEITVLSGFLEKLNHGDQVMADKGFNCQDELASVGATLVIPTFLDKKVQFSSKETNHNKVVASLRVHVERLMERIKNWHIFDRKIPITLAPIASDMLVVVSALTNFHPPLIN